MRLLRQAVFALIVIASWPLVAIAGSSVDEPPSDLVTFNKDVEIAHRAGERWTTAARQVAVKFVGGGCDCHERRVFEIRTRDRDAVVIAVIDNGLHDDSIAAMRYRLRLKLTAQGFWEIRAATRSWRCWPERGHQNFSTALCG